MSQELSKAQPVGDIEVNLQNILLWRCLHIYALRGSMHSHGQTASPAKSLLLSLNDLLWDCAAMQPLQRLERLPTTSQPCFSSPKSIQTTLLIHINGWSYNTQGKTWSQFGYILKMPVPVVLPSTLNCIHLALNCRIILLHIEKKQLQPWLFWHTRLQYDSVF